jgi:hypothetical protein
VEARATIYEHLQLGRSVLTSRSHPYVSISSTLLAIPVSGVMQVGASDLSDHQRASDVEP